MFKLWYGLVIAMFININIFPRVYLIKRIRIIVSNGAIGPINILINIIRVQLMFF